MPPNPDTDALIALLAETFPQTFSVFEGRRRPLKIGVDRDILARLGDAIAPPELYAALRWYCGNPRYLDRLRAGAERIDLDGAAAGTVSAEDAAHARAKLDKARQRRAAEIQPAESAPPPPPPPEPTRLGLAELKAAARKRKAQAA